MKNVLKIAFAILISFTLHSCSVENEKISLNDDELIVENSDSNKLSLNQKFENTIFSYQATKSDNFINSHFKISSLDKKNIYETQYNLDLGESDYKLYQTDKVLNIANEIDFGFEEDTYEAIDFNMNIFFKKVLENLNSDLEIKHLLSSLYFHNSIIRIKKRSKQNKSKVCKCTLHPSYLVEKTGFICQEDFLIPKEIIIELINEKNESLMSKSEKDVFKEYITPLISNDKGVVSFDKFFTFFVSKERYESSLSLLKKSNNKKLSSKGWCLLGQGSSHGCCGNYKGYCYYWHEACYVHDKLCKTCTPRWFCFSGCVPDEIKTVKEEDEKVPFDFNEDIGIEIPS